MENLQQQLKECRDRFNAVKREAQVGHLIIVPIFKKLGWSDTTIEPEYPIDEAGKVDFALLDSKERPAVLIEAKAPGKLNVEGEAQLFRYARSQSFDSGVEMLLVLTDGEEWWFYLPWKKGVPITDRQFDGFNLRKDNVDGIADKLVNFLSRERVLNGAAQKSAAEKWKLRNDRKELIRALPGILNNFHQNIPEQWAQDIAKKVKETLHFDCSTKEIRSAVRDSFKPIRSYSPAHEPRDFSGDMTSVEPTQEAARVSSDKMAVHYNGRIYQGGDDIDTFIQVISGFGIERVYNACRENSIKINRYHLVLEQREIPEFYSRKKGGKQIYRTRSVGNYKVMSNHDTPTKKVLLEKVARALNLQIKIELPLTPPMPR